MKFTKAEKEILIQYCLNSMKAINTYFDSYPQSSQNTEARNAELQIRWTLIDKIQSNTKGE